MSQIRTEIYLCLSTVWGKDQVSDRVSAKHRTEEETVRGERWLSQWGTGQTQRPGYK